MKTRVFKSGDLVEWERARGVCLTVVEYDEHGVVVIVPNTHSEVTLPETQLTHIPQPRQPRRFRFS